MLTMWQLICEIMKVKCIEVNRESNLLCTDMVKCFLCYDFRRVILSCYINFQILKLQLCNILRTWKQDDVKCLWNFHQYLFGELLISNIIHCYEYIFSLRIIFSPAMQSAFNIVLILIWKIKYHWSL